MLSRGPEPSLLVSVDDNYDPLNFEFWVINGCWRGSFTDGDIRVNDMYDNAVVGQLEIACTNQKRLQGEYNDVFANFHNPDYVGPEPVKVCFDDMDDDIPF